MLEVYVTTPPHQNLPFHPNLSDNFDLSCFGKAVRAKIFLISNQAQALEIRPVASR